MEQVEKKRSMREIVLIGAKLLLICALVAGIISFVYSLTLDKYNENLQGTKNQALGQIFGTSELQSSVISPEGSEQVIYAVYVADSLIGYCVEAKAPGFGGDIELMVGYNEAREVCGVSVVAHSETPGFGALAAEPAFLDQYKGKSGEVVLGDGIDAVSGATISSRAVTDAVNAASTALDALLNGGVQ